MRTMGRVIFISVLLALPLPALAKTFKVSEYKKSGIYEQSIGDFRYLYDTITGLCYFMYTDGSTAAGLTSVDCHSVTKRPEWSGSLGELAPPAEPEANPEVAKPKKK